MWLRDWARRSLASRITLYVTLAFAFTLCLGVVALHVVLSRALYSRVDADLALRLESLSQLGTTPPGSEARIDLLAEYGFKAHRDFFQVWDARGRPLARSGSSAGRDLPLPPATALESREAYALDLPDGHRGRAIAARMELPE